MTDHRRCRRLGWSCVFFFKAREQWQSRKAVTAELIRARNRILSSLICLPFCHRIRKKHYCVFVHVQASAKETENNNNKPNEKITSPQHCTNA